MNEYFDKKTRGRRFHIVPEHLYPSTKIRGTTFQKMVVVKDSINRISFEITHKMFIKFSEMRLGPNLLSWSPVL
jgi:hypothetical protein